MVTITLNIPDISCGHCTSSIEETLNELEGVTSVKADVAKKNAVVKFDEELVTEVDIIEVLDDIGFEATKA